MDKYDEMELDVTQEFEQINGRQVVKKHVATIHCSNKLSLLERKISNALLFHAFPNLKNQLTYEIRLDELKRLIGANTRNHQALKDALKKLISTVLEWNLLGENVPELDIDGWNASTILSSVSVHKGVVKYQYSELIKTLLVDPKIYGKINLTIQARFRSSYALALYENCSRYRGLPYTKNFDIAIFRKLMGVEDGKYCIFRDFNRRVLNPAISEINTCSDIRVTPEITRAGRSVKSIKFRLEERAIKKRLGFPNEDKIEAFAINTKHPDQDIYQNLKKEYGSDRVKKAIQYVESRPAYKNGEINNVLGYVTSALVNGYEEIKPEKIKKSKLTDNQKRKSSWILHKTDYLRHITGDVIKCFCLLDIEAQMLAFNEFMKLIKTSKKNNIIFYTIQQHCEKFDGFISLVQSNDVNTILFFEDGFSEYLLKKFDHIQKRVASFDDFLTGVW